MNFTKIFQCNELYQIVQFNEHFKIVQFIELYQVIQFNEHLFLFGFSEFPKNSNVNVMASLNSSLPQRNHKVTRLYPNKCVHWKICCGFLSKT